MSWGLIVVMYGSAVAMHDFNTEEACRNAIVEMVDANLYKPTAICVPKG